MTTGNNPVVETPMITQPFQTGDVVICYLDYLTVHSGDKVRVLECVESNDCESGWLVKATEYKRGRIAKRPPVAIEDVDSGWFRKVTP
jgi:hypothetical protein